MKELLCILFGYGLGSLNPAYLIGRVRGFDIRKRGSGNAGASNAVITMGAWVGVFSALFDIFKAFLAVQLSSVLFAEVSFARELAGTACILGHIFPFYMAFRGGKGLACIGGMILAFDWRVFLILLAAALVAVMVIDYICVVPMSVAVLFPFINGMMTDRWLGSLIFGVASVAILLRHTENIRRIRKGAELRFSYLWKKDKEMDRVRQNIDNAKEQQAVRERD